LAAKQYSSALKQYCSAYKQHCFGFTPCSKSCSIYFFKFFHDYLTQKPIKMAKSRCSREYRRLGLDVLDVFALGVKTGVFTHDPPFTAPPMTESEFDDLIQAYPTMRSAYVQGGLAQKGDFLNAKAALLDGIDELADYVDEVADGDENIITNAGFVPTDITKTPAVKAGQPVVTVKRGIAGELFASCEKIAGVIYYGCIMTIGAALPDGVFLTPDGKLAFEGTPGTTRMAFDLTKQREKHFTGLTHDETYYFYFYAVNAAGVSPLSEVVSIVCW
jgi:hypothetical protein